MKKTRQLLLARIERKLTATLCKHKLTVTIGSDLRGVPPIIRSHPKKSRVSELVRPEFNPSAGPHDTIVVILQRRGRDIGCAVVRLKRIKGSLAEAYERKTLFSEDSNRLKPSLSAQKIRCVSTLAQNEIRSCHIAVSTGLCVHPKTSGKAYPKTVLRSLMRLLHMRAFVEWRWSYLIAHAIDEIACKHAFDTDGFSTIQSGIFRTEAGETTGYRLMIAERKWFENLVGHRLYGDPSVSLSDPQFYEAP